MKPSVGRALVLCLPLLAGCVAPRPPGAEPVTPEVANGEAVLAALGTPFYALFKATTCVVSTVIALPSVAALALTDRPRHDEEGQELARGVGHNCYGSYALHPS